MLVLRWIYLVSMQPIVSGDYSSRISGKLFTYSKVTDILANPNWSYVHCQYIISLAHWSVESPVDRAGSHTVPFLPPHNSECPSSDRQDFTFIHDCALTATKLGFSPVPLSTFPKLDCERLDIRSTTLSAWRTALEALSGGQELIKEIVQQQTVLD